MRKKFLLMAMFLFGLFGLIRTDEVVIGSGTVTSSYLPTYSFYNYSLTQQIYTTEDVLL